MTIFDYFLGISIFLGLEEKKRSKKMLAAAGKLLTQASNGYRNAMQKRPLVTTMMTTGGTALLGDVVCQTAIEKNGYQPARSLVLAGWAAGFTGPFMLGWLRGLERVLPSSLPPAGRLLGKATLEMTVAFPIILAGFFGG